MACDKRFTYSGDPSKSSKDEVRFLIGDTNKARPLFDDREILFQLTQTPNTKIAGAELLEIKAREFATIADIRVGDVSKSYSKASDSLQARAEDLRKDALKGALPFFGGLSKSGKKALADDQDATQPQFAIGQNDNPFAVQLNRDITNLFGLVGPSGF